MSEYEPSTYGDKIADVYDEMYPMRANVKPAVNALAKLADDGPVLELGIGTGRIALPLAERGIAVHGIDASESIVEKMRDKPGGADIPVTIGDFANVGVDGKFSMVYVVFNTFYALLTQEDQVRCFRNVADHLTNDGVFVIEAFVPDTARFVRGQNISVTSIETDSAMIDLTRHDPVTQIVTSQHLIVSEGGVKLYPVKLRYVWPSELDLMAQFAGLRLRSRHADWNESPFTSASGSHVSVYGRE
jgi:SAM-dependent methyltransferase